MPRLRQVSKRGLAPHHEQGGGDPFAGNVRNDQRQRIFIHKEEIVKISSHLPGRIHHGVEVKITAWKREVPGQSCQLDGAGKFQFLFHALFRRCDIPLQGIHRLIDAVRQG